MSDSGKWIMVITLTFTLLFVVGMRLGYDQAERNLHKEAIQRGYAHHNSQTGRWEWNKKEGD